MGSVLGWLMLASQSLTRYIYTEPQSCPGLGLRHGRVWAALVKTALVQAAVVKTALAEVALVKTALVQAGGCLPWDSDPLASSACVRVCGWGAPLCGGENAVQGRARSAVSGSSPELPFLGSPSPCS